MLNQVLSSEFTLTILHYVSESFLPIAVCDSALILSCIGCWFVSFVFSIRYRNVRGKREEVLDIRKKNYMFA